MTTMAAKIRQFRVGDIRATIKIINQARDAGLLGEANG